MSTPPITPPPPTHTQLHIYIDLLTLSFFRLEDGGPLKSAPPLPSSTHPGHLPFNPLLPTQSPPRPHPQDSIEDAGGQFYN